MFFLEEKKLSNLLFKMINAVDHNYMVPGYKMMTLTLRNKPPGKANIKEKDILAKPIITHYAESVHS